ncbi:fungal-specific transcription factor domain-containing protein [Globomyces pollinis-pini]|nr:fungal-specific transcription factor domain-containing protein [Globomyces pollinis-pini]
MREEESEKSRKRQTQSCDRCKVKKRRCDGNTPCENCIKADSECTMNIEQKKRGPKRSSDVNVDNSDSTPKKSRILINSSQKNSNGIPNIFENHPTENEFIPQMSHSIFDNGQLIMKETNNNGNLTVQQPRVLDFDTDFAFNFGLQNIDIPFDSVKPSSFNPSINQQPLQIDPEVLNLYTQLNPKLSLQQELDFFLQSTLMGNNQVPNDDSFISAPTNLSTNELPGIPSSFYLHLISMFFTYFHQSMPILDEKLFMENLIPVNNHPPMLLNIIYAIGCHYSRSPQLYQVPFYNPQKASEYFINQALISTPAPETWASISSDSISVSQASLLLSAYDCITHKTHTWMMIGMAIRLNQRFEVHTNKIKHSFLSLCNNTPKFHLDCSTEERKRAWWGTMMCDLFLTLSTGTPLMINELDYIETITSPSGQMSPTTCPLAEADISVIQTQIRSKKQNSANDSDKWMPFFSGFPKDTIFGASDVNSECWGRQSTGFFQVNHLFSKSDDITHLMQLSFITRRAIRYVTAPKVPTCQTQSVSLLTNLIPTSTSEIVRLHDSLILWFESLPIELRFWKSLEGLTSNSALEMDNYCSLNADQRLSSTAVLINLLFTATISLLHQKNAESSSINFSPNNANASNSNHMFRISSSMLSRGVFDSSAMLRLSYKGTCYLLKRVYGQYMPPSPTIIPPSEIVGTPVISALIMPVVIGLLSQQIYAGKLMETGSRLSLSAHPETVGVDPLESVIFPVLDNISQVWPVAKTHANSLRQLTQQLQSKLNSSQNSNQIASLWQKSSFHADTTSPSQPPVTTTPTFNIFSRTNEVNQTAQLQFTNNGINGTQGTVNVANVAPTPAASITSADQNEVVNSGAKTDMNWHDLRNAFEDEFLL